MRLVDLLGTNYGISIRRASSQVGRAARRFSAINHACDLTSVAAACLSLSNHALASARGPFVHCPSSVVQWQHHSRPTRTVPRDFLESSNAATTLCSFSSRARSRLCLCSPDLGRTSITSYGFIDCHHASPVQWTKVKVKSLSLFLEAVSRYRRESAATNAL